MQKIGIFSVPRSGSTWLGQIFNSHPQVLYRFQPNFAYSFPHQLSPTSNEDDITKFISELVKSTDDFTNGKISISGKRNIEFDKTNFSHLVFKETHFINVVENLLEKTDFKIIGLVRSPFSTINSWLKTPKEFFPEWDVKTQWKTAELKNENKDYNYFGYNKWLATTTLFLELQAKYPNQFKLVTYNSLLKETSKCIESVFSFCNLELTDQTKNFILESKQKQESDAYSTFKLKVNDEAWKTELPTFIVNEIKQDSKFQKINEKFKWTI